MTEIYPNYRWFDTTVRSILQHEVYIGNLVAQRQTHIFKVGKSFARPKEEWVIVKDVFETIVDRELWERVQESFANPTRSRKRTGQASIFSGMVFCDTCNRRISFVPEREEKIYVGSCQEYCIIRELITKIYVGDVCNKEASNRKQEIDCQHHTIPNQRNLFYFGK